MMSMSGATAPSGRRAGTGPAARTPCRKDLDWDLWLGPAPPRPFKGETHAARIPIIIIPGTGAAGLISAPAPGDMACHTWTCPSAPQAGLSHRNRSRNRGLHQGLLPDRIQHPFPIPGSAKAWCGLPSLVRRRHPVQPQRRRIMTATINLPRKSTADILPTIMERIPGSGCLMVGDKGQDLFG